MKVAALIALVLFPSLAYAKPDQLTSDAVNWARTGRQVWSNRYILDANTTTRPITIDGGNTPACFGWNDMITVSTLAETTVCLSLTSSISLGDQTTRQATTFAFTHGSEQGGASDARGACVTLAPNERWTVMPAYATWFPTSYDPPLTTKPTQSARAAPGRRTGICSAPQDTVIASPVYPFCRSGTNGDCTEAGVTGGTCSLIDTAEEVTRAKSLGCAYLIAKANTASTDLTVTVER
jgi:hypothetical protein